MIYFSYVTVNTVKPLTMTKLIILEIYGVMVMMNINRIKYERDIINVKLYIGQQDGGSFPTKLLSN